jgi:competence protein ComEC
LRIEGKFAPIHRYDNPGANPAWVRFQRTGTALRGFADRAEFEERSVGLAATVDEARRRVRQRIEATYPTEAVGLARALVLGETDLERDVSEAFRRTGLSHILAVSGTHLVVAVLGLERALRALLVRVRAVAERVVAARVTALLALPLVWGYASIAGGSGSVVRAALMVSVHLVATALGRRPSGTRSFSAALAVGLVGDPMLVFDASFTLSAAATFGLLALGGSIAGALGGAPREGAPWWARAWAAVAQSAGSTVAATLACLPLTAAMSGEVSLVGIVANLVAAPIGELFALPFAIVHAVAAPWPSVERGAALVAGGALRAVALVAKLAASVGGTVEIPPPTMAHLAVLALAAVVFGFRGGSWGRVVGALAALVAVELGVRARETRHHELRVTVLDVAQGDAIFVELPQGQVMLIDGGGLPGQPLDLGARVIRPFLRAKRRDRLDYVVLSHPHPDHYGGLRSVVEGASSVGELWEGGDRGMPILDGLRARVAERGGVVREPHELCGGPRELGGALVEVLSPCSVDALERSANDRSLVVRIRYGDHAFLFTGDAEEEAERELVDRGEDLRADVLKVGHHGSRTSTGAAWLDAVRPTYAAISCGVRNRFGHPHSQTSERLAERGITTLRTDEAGAWTFRTDGARLVVEPASP